MSNFSFSTTAIDGVIIVNSNIYPDNRGQFSEVYNKKEFKEYGLNYNFVQQNQSVSKYGVLRGLHFQINYPQTKLVRCIKGVIFDVAVDLRKESPTYGQWIAAILSSENNKQLLIPQGFAHGFLTLSEEAIVGYSCDDFYHPNDEGGIIWNDPDLNIAWPQIDTEIILSEKDKKHKTLKEIQL